MKEHLYQIQGYDLHEGERMNEVLVTVTAETELEAFMKAGAMAPRELYHTMTVEEIVDPLGPAPAEDKGQPDDGE